MQKILFVCLGNICRSPLAEGIFNAKVQEMGLQDQFTSDSAGTAGYHIGETPDQRSIDVAHKHGIQLKHRGQQFEKYHADTFDFLIAMDSSNFQDIAETVRSKLDYLYLMRDFDPQGKGLDVPDPYYGGQEGFENVYQILDRSIDQFIQFLSDKK